MKRLSFFVVLLIIVAVAVFAAVALDGNEAGAVPGGVFNDTCRACHATTGSLGTGTGIHAVSAHASFSCSQCHAVVGDAPDLSKCVVCHGSAVVIASANTTHSTTAGCTACHAAATTTTTAGSTTSTTAGSTTSTTAGSTTSTTAGSTTSTTAGSTTSTTAGSTTSTTQGTTTTTLPTGVISVTG